MILYYQTFFDTPFEYIYFQESLFTKTTDTAAHIARNQTHFA